ncbi:MAG: hypothetical protein IJ600_13000 [Lachnospiraceae bacterium]|nr:hypothetical protein [Lachnospiraceae bacterium]
MKAKKMEERKSQMFHVTTSSLYTAETQMREQLNERYRILMEIDDCARILDEMEELEGEAQKVFKVEDQVSEENYFMQLLVMAADDIRMRYETAEKLSLESAQSCPRSYREVEASGIQISVYENGVVRSVSG